MATVYPQTFAAVCQSLSRIISTVNQTIGIAIKITPSSFKGFLSPVLDKISCRETAGKAALVCLRAFSEASHQV